MTVYDVVRQYYRRWKYIADCRKVVDDFAERLNATRKHRNQSYEQFALDNGIAPSRIRNLCHGETLPRLEELDSLSPLLDESVAEH